MIKLILIVFALIAIPTTQASIYIEPYAGLAFGDGDLDHTENSKNYEHDSWMLGTTLGGRAGLQIHGFIFGAVGSYSYLSIKTRKENQADITDSHSYDNTLQQTLGGVFFGFRLPLPMKIWGEYYLLTKGKMTYSESRSSNIFTKDDKLKGNGYAFGVGYTGTPLFDINFEGRFLKYDELTLTGTKNELPNNTYTSKLRMFELILSISMPFDF
jgi:hypothetical protein